MVAARQADEQMVRGAVRIERQGRLLRERVAPAHHARVLVFVPARPPAGATGGATRPSPAVPAASGNLRLLTAPPDAEILIDGLHVAFGSVFDLKLAPGPRRLQIRAPGYQAFDTTIAVTVGQTLSLKTIALHSRESTEP